MASSAPFLPMVVVPTVLMDKEFKQGQELALAHLLPMVVPIAPLVDYQILLFQVIPQQRHRFRHAQLVL